MAIATRRSRFLPALPLGEAPAVLWLVRLAAVAVFVGRAWQHLYWDIPLREWLWHQQSMEPVVQWWGYSWREWVTSPTVAAGIRMVVKGLGVFYLVAAWAAATLGPTHRVRRYVVALGGWLLVGLALLYTKEKFYHLGQFFEYSLQFGSPFFLLWLVAAGRFSVAQLWVVRIAIALTFTCHGLYAIGYYPRPANFTEMVMAGLGLEQAAAMHFLHWAGYLDFVASACILLPWRRVAVWGAIYCTGWGLLTTLARVWAYLWLTDPGTVLLQWVHESVYRWPHVLIPLAVWVVWRQAGPKDHPAHPA